MTDDEDRQLAAVVAIALSRYIGHLQRDRLPVPAEVQALARMCALRASARRCEPVFGWIGGADNDEPMTTTLLSRHQVAEAMGVSVRKVDQLIETGELAAVKLGRSTKIRSTDVEVFIDGLGRRAVGSFRDTVELKEASA